MPAARGSPPLNAPERALSLAEQAYGPDNPRVAEPLTSLGQLALDGGDARRAATMHRRALAIRRAHVGERTVITALSEHNLGDALARVGERDEAIEHLEAARRIFEAELPVDHAYRRLNAEARARAEAPPDPRPDPPPAGG